MEKECKRDLFEFKKKISNTRNSFSTIRIHFIRSVLLVWKGCFAPLKKVCFSWSRFPRFVLFGKCFFFLVHSRPPIPLIVLKQGPPPHLRINFDGSPIFVSGNVYSKHRAKFGAGFFLLLAVLHTLQWRLLCQCSERILRVSLMPIKIWWFYVFIWFGVVQKRTGLYRIKMASDICLGWFPIYFGNGRIFFSIFGM